MPLEPELYHVGRWIERHARATPRHLALVDEQRSLDYAALHERVLRCAGLLTERGVGYVPDEGRARIEFSCNCSGTTAIDVEKGQLGAALMKEPCGCCPDP